MGDRVGVEMFHVSKMNVRFGEPFGQDQDDKNLIANLKEGKIVQPFKARPEAEGYGVFIGSRRFLGKKTAGVKSFVVGVDCLIEEMTDGEAREASLIENLFRKDINPMIRAKKLNEIIIRRRESLRATARRLGVGKSTLSEWLKILELSPKMQEAVAKGVLFYTDGLMIARAELDMEVQDKLAEVLETQGKTAFKKELAQAKKGLTKPTSAKKLSKDDKSKIVLGKDYWKQLTQSLRDFANYWCDFSTLEEWEDAENYHLKLEVVMPKDLNESVDAPYEGLENLSADEAPQICADCGQDILEGDPFAEKDGLYYCAKCSDGDEKP